MVPEIEVGEDSFLMASYHAGKIPRKLCRSVSCPSEPTFEEASCSGSAFIIQEVPEYLLEEITAVQNDLIFGIATPHLSPHPNFKWYLHIPSFE